MQVPVAAALGMLLMVIVVIMVVVVLMVIVILLAMLESAASHTRLSHQVGTDDKSSRTHY